MNDIVYMFLKKFYASFYFKEKHQTLHARLASQAEQNVTKVAGLERSIHILQNGKAELESNLETEIKEKEMLKKELIILRNKTEGDELLQVLLVLNLKP